MITFRVTKQSFQVNTFFARKTTPIANTLNAFGYLKSVDKRGNCIGVWYDNFRKVELKYTIKELQRDYKSIYPYFTTKTFRGGIWKYSYQTLLNKICPEQGFSKIMVDPIVCKVRPIKKNKVEICDARYVIEHNMKDLYGKIIDIKNHNAPPVFSIRTSEGIYKLSRTYFTLIPQDSFTLFSIRCN